MSLTNNLNCISRSLRVDRRVTTKPRSPDTFQATGQYKGDILTNLIIFNDIWISDIGETVSKISLVSGKLLHVSGFSRRCKSVRSGENPNRVETFLH